MRRKIRQIIALLLALLMLTGNESLAYAAGNPETEETAGQEAVQEQAESEESAEDEADKQPDVPETDEEEPAQEQGPEVQETEPAAPQPEAAADEGLGTAVSVQTADPVSGDYTYSVDGAYATITGYTGSAASLVLPEELDGYTVQAIGDRAFSGNLTLTSVEIPANVEEIGNWVFEKCVNLKTVTLQNGLQTIGREFLQDTAVTEVTLPKSVTYAAYALGGAQNLVKVTFAEGTKTVPSRLLQRYYGSDPGSNVSEIVLPESVTQIGDYAFYGCISLQSVTLPGSLETIGGYAFNGCTRLEEAEIPGSVTRIGYNAFDGCTNLRQVLLNADGAGEELTIENYVFRDCVNLTEVTIPSNVAELGDYVFEGAVNLKNILLENGISSIGREFLLNTAVTEVTLPKSITDAGYALGGAQNLVRVTFAEGTKTVPSRLLQRYYGSDAGSNVSEIVLPEGVTQIGDYAFHSCVSLQSVTLPGSLETIGGYAFNGCTRLEKAEIPGSVTRIGNNAFDGCTNLRQVLLNADGAGEELTIENYAFRGCVNLTEVTIPSNVAELGNYVFEGAVNLKNILLENGISSIGREFLLNTAVTEVTLPKSVTYAAYALGGAQNLVKVTFAEGTKTVPSNLLRRYFSSDPGSRVSEVVLPESVTQIGDYAFYDCDSLQSVTLPGNLETIGNYGFYGCGGLTAIHFPASLIKIDHNAFASCALLAEVTFEKGGADQTIGDAAFRNCTSLTEMTLPAEAVSVGNEVFAGCTSLADMTLQTGVETIGREFLRDTAVTEVILPKSVTYAEYALGGAQSLVKVTFAEGTKTVPSNLLRRYFSSDPGSRVSEIVLPESVTQIGDHAFYDCDSLQSVTLPGNLETIGNYGFYGCGGLTAIHFPASLIKIDHNAFASCALLAEVTFEEGGADQTIGDAAFRNCTSLTEMTLPAEAVSVGNEVFAGCTSLADMTLETGVETIGREFLRDTAVTEMILPKSVTYAEYALGGAQNLVKVTFAEGTKTVPSNLLRRYYSSDPGSNVSEVVMPDSITRIGSGAFYDCDALTGIALPGNLATIENYGFFQCSGLTAVHFPASLTKIDHNAFASCALLSEVIFEEGTADQTIGDAAFRNCTSLTEIRLPDRLVSVGNDVFSGCTGMRDLTLNDGLETIGRSFIADTQVTSLTIPRTVTYMSYALSSAVNLQSVTFAQGMQKIPDYAVAKYYSSDPAFQIQMIYLPDTANVIGNKSFRDFTGTLYIIHEDSETTLTAIDNEINFQNKVTGIMDREDRYLDRNRTYYRMAMSGATNSGYINLALQYSFKEEAEELLDTSGMELTIKVPAAATVSANSFKLNGEDYPTATDEDGYIVVPVTKTEGTVSFSLQIPDTRYLMSYAKLTYRYGGTEKTEPIGIVNMGSNMLTLSVPDETASSLVKVTGFTQPENQVDLYLEGTRTASVTASKTGAYTAEILLSEQPADGDMFKIEAKTLSGEKESSAVAYTKYKTEALELTQCTMYYRNKSYDLLAIAGTRPVISWANNKTFTFKIAFNHNDRVGEVQVVSAKNGEEKTLEAQWNEEEQAFVAAGFEGYVPGILTIRYGNSPGAAYEGATAVTETVYEEGSTVGHESRVALNDISEFYYLKEQERGLISLPDLTLTRIEVDGESGYLNPELVYIEKNHKTYGCQEMYLPEANGTYTRIRLGIGLSDTATAEAALYGIAQSWPMADDAVDTAKEVKKLIDLLAEESEEPDDAEVYALVKTTLDKAEETFDPGTTEYAKVQELKTRLEFVDLINNTNRAYNKINKVIENASHYSNDPDILPADRITEEMKNAVDTMEKVSKNVSNKQLQKIMEEMTDKGWFDDSLMEKLMEDVLEDMNEELEFNPKYAIDPSGYVYEAFPENRLEGVTATIYYQDPETKETVLWNAAEYDQENPLYTDQDGAYAWDVPEGLWQVKYEKEGYETAYSEWLPVPPPQLDVNIGMVSLEAPEVESLTVFSDRAEVVFSRYMNPDTLKGMKLLDGAGKELSYTLEYDEAGESENGTLLAKAFVLKLKGEDMAEPGSTCRLVLSGSEKSYADVGAQQGEIAATVQQNLEILAPDEVTVKMGETLSVPVRLAGNPGTVSLEAVSAYEEFMTVQAVTDQSVDIYGKLYGETELILRVPGTDLSKTVKVTVGKVSDTPEVQPSVVLSQSVYTMSAGESLEIVPQVYPEGTAGGWTIISGGDVVTLDGNIFTAKTAGEAVLRYSLETGDGSAVDPVYAECRILVKEAPLFIRGDANGDGKTDISDLRLVLRHVCRKATLEGTAYEAADVTDDDRVDIQDLRKILRFVCRKITEL